jgi:outer membrane protein OmpA-like peptidoglycan-associated protein/tetratricopeptide (TPR) repeat protein
MKTIYILAIAMLISVIAIGDNTKKADRLFDKWDYYKAAQLYQEAAQKHPTQYVYYRLGQCYQKMHRYKDAVAAYDSVNKMGHYDNPSFYLDYGLVLKSNYRYNDAEIAFTTYGSMVPNDARGSFYESSCDTVTKDINYNLPISVSPIASINSHYSDLSPEFYKDGMVFISSRQIAGHDKIYDWDGEYYLDIMYAKKTNGDTGFTEVATLSGEPLNGKYHNGPVAFSPNYDTIYFNRVSKELKGEKKRTLNIERNKIYYAVYKNGSWTNVKPFEYNNDTFSVATPCLANNGTRIYFSSDMPGGFGGDDLYYCDRQGDGWSKPVNLGSNVNTFGNEKFPQIDSAGNLYFSSDGYKGFGGMDICVAKNANGTFTHAQVLKEPFNSPGDDYGITFIRKEKIGYFSSNRNGDGNEHIYYFNMNHDSLPCKVNTSDYVVGFRCPQQQQPVVITDTMKVRPYHFTSPQYSINEENELTRIHFDFDKANIRPDAAVILDSVASFMHKYTDINIMVNGYCDWRGSYPYNLALSQRRSESTIDYLAKKGVNRERMKPKGYGKTHFLNRCVDGVVCSEFEQQENRRVEILYSPNKPQNNTTSFIIPDKPLP